MTSTLEWSKALREVVFPEKLCNAAVMTPTYSIQRAFYDMNKDNVGGNDAIPIPLYPNPYQKYSLVMVDNDATKHPGRDLIAGMAVLIQGGVLLFAVPLKKLSGLGAYVDAGLLPKPSAVYRLIGSQAAFVVFRKGAKFSYTTWYEL